MPKVSVVVRAATKAARKAERSRVGLLSHHLVSAVAMNRYKHACSLFFRWLVDLQIPMSHELSLFDEQACQYIDACWSEGEAKNIVSDLLSGLHLLTPAVKGHLQGAWKLHSAWAKHELTVRCFPMTLSMVQAFAGQALSHQWVDVAVVLLLSFHCVLRTGEAC
jgi:hypothetical protein